MPTVMLTVLKPRAVYGKIGESIGLNLEGGCVDDANHTMTTLSGRRLHPQNVFVNGRSLWDVDRFSRIYAKQNATDFAVRQQMYLAGMEVTYNTDRGRVIQYYWQGRDYSPMQWQEYWLGLYASAIGTAPFFEEICDLVEKSALSVYIPCLLRSDMEKMGFAADVVCVEATPMRLQCLMEGSVVRTHRERWRHEFVVAQLLLERMKQ